MTSRGLPQYVAHISEDGERYESVKQHLAEVAELASSFAAKFDATDWGYAAGMMHDIGKYSEEFQRRILNDGPRVDHSTAGAYVAATSINAMLAYCIVGHHAGLPDGGVKGDIETTLCGRLYKASHGSIPEYEAYKEEVIIPSLGNVPIEIDETRLGDPHYRNDLFFSYAFFVRMIFSCLVDADYLCTERFMKGQERLSPAGVLLPELRDALEAKLATFYPPLTRVNEVRCNVLDDCRRAAEMETGVFSLTVPTGGGKTYALMRFALHHATQPGREFDRVICVEPYTSIIEQNAAVYREVFGEGQVLEHHCNYDFESDRGDGELNPNPMRLATENWDVPIVVTTNVQLFESLYACKTSRCRKLHNIARSIIVLDEAQMIPTRYLLPCVKVLAELVKHYGCTVVLCTATQPALNDYFVREGLTVHEIASHPSTLVKSLSRVCYSSLGRISDEELADCIKQQRQSLCIVNSRRQARVLFDLLSESMSDTEGTLFHLSTLMYPRHRLKVIASIRDRVRSGLPCTVVSTSLVEAGVDLDFGTVFRALTGIDSIVQAAGRCNREMRRSPNESFVYLFSPEVNYAIPVEIMQRSEVACGVIPELRNVGDLMALDSLEVVEAFFGSLYAFKSLDDKEIVKQLSNYGRFGSVPSIPFAHIASQFRLVENEVFTVIVPTSENSEDISRLMEGRASRATMRRLCRYGVNVYRTDRDALYRTGVIEQVDKDLYVLTDESRYEIRTGLDLVAGGGEGVFL